MFPRSLSVRSQGIYPIDQIFKKGPFETALMENYVFDADKDATEEILAEAQDETEDGFMKGYGEEKEAEECAECGAAVKDEKKVVREVGEESFTFCSEQCANEFAEALAEE